MITKRTDTYMRLDEADTLKREQDVSSAVAVKLSGIKKPGGRVIQSVDRAVDLLEALAKQDEECSLNGISALVGLNLSTCHHLLSTLMRRGYVQQGPRTKKYFLGNKIMELSQARKRQIDLIRVAAPMLQKLKNETGEAAVLASIQGRELTELMSVDSAKRAEVIGGTGGMPNAAHAIATGKAILAWLPEGEIAAIIGEKGMAQVTDKSITSLANLLNELALVRRHGYAIDEEEFQIGVVCVSAAIRNYSGAVIASIGCTFPKSRASDEHLKWIKNQVKSAAQALSQELGSP